MPQCHKCGRSIPDKFSVFRLIKTGVDGGGQDYHRNVRLCPECDTNQDGVERSRRNIKVVLCLGVVGAVVGGIVYRLLLQ